MATYPSGIKGSASYPWTDLIDGTTYPTAAHIEDCYDEVTAIETELGTNPKGSYSSVKARIEAIEDDYLAVGKKRRININSVDPDVNYSPIVDWITNTNVIVPVMWFGDSSDSKIHFIWHVPYDCDTSEDITLILDCCIKTASSGTNVKLELHYFPAGTSWTSIGSATEYSDDSDFIAVNTWGAKEIRRDSSLVISASNISAHDTLFITLMRDVSDETTDQYTDDFGILNIAMEYTNKNV